MIRVAVLDDWMGVARSSTDWSPPVGAYERVKLVVTKRSAAIFPDAGVFTFTLGGAGSCTIRSVGSE
jgi:hypothetical protein